MLLCEHCYGSKKDEIDIHYIVFPVLLNAFGIPCFVCANVFGGNGLLMYRLLHKTLDVKYASLN